MGESASCFSVLESAIGGEIPPLQAAFLLGIEDSVDGQLYRYFPMYMGKQSPFLRNVVGPVVYDGYCARFRAVEEYECSRLLATRYLYGQGLVEYTAVNRRFEPRFQVDLIFSKIGNLVCCRSLLLIKELDPLVPEHGVRFSQPIARTITTAHDLRTGTIAAIEENLTSVFESDHEQYVILQGLGVEIEQ